MTQYFLVNQQDYFAAGFMIHNGSVSVDTVAGLDVAAAVNSDSPASAKTALYQQVAVHPAAGSERTQLTAAEQAQLTQKLAAQFTVTGTDDLEGC
ncbi:MAG: hypothetical protein LKH74_00920 [Levilactobacillus sp.]|jgi:hypothetical protein|uniref:Uncharacterized protein n=1 Tax=Levilactobacillus suantsaiihabitans TaxID=2487722 RepID=A0A4Z0J9M6_9LACO|nr:MULTISPECIES: hypothetical protein [Levilactobacillus]MCH4123391.1 hypothetical protein [Levilactobacillus sp.]MCI1552471.1 hypothetical protein [Levilactobacillus sp.]MCI1599825.1 hypothetical protein [Levilactobacillus sp.]MCI1606618.1 hypothetical protein [Levilactobacillus sp.]TGD19029.1 hypothetical protein EGT51_06425 [Levilactobacillus suantsaiihabitans]